MELIIIIAFLTSLISLILLRPIAVKINLVDFPTERKDHKGNIPLIGGGCIFLGFLNVIYFVEEFNTFSIILLITSFLILIHGVWDDFANLRAKTKMIFQAILTYIVIYITDVKVESFGYLFGMTNPIDLGVFSIPITLIAVVGLTNAINMIDGLDGLAAGIVLVAIVGLIHLNPMIEISFLTSILIMSLLYYLLFSLMFQMILK